MYKFFASAIGNGGNIPSVNPNQESNEVVGVGKNLDNFSEQQKTQDVSSISNQGSGSKQSKMQAIQKAEHENSSKLQVMSRLNNAHSQMNQSYNQFQNFMNSYGGNAKHSRLQKKLYDHAKKMFTDSHQLALAHGLPNNKEGLAGNGVKSILSFVQKTQDNYNQVAEKMNNDKTLTLPGMMKLSQNFNQANSNYNILISIAKQLTDTVNKITNAQI